MEKKENRGGKREGAGRKFTYEGGVSKFTVTIPNKDKELFKEAVWKAIADTKAIVFSDQSMQGKGSTGGEL